jgi:membrane associated rhomboid family serine protease
VVSVLVALNVGCFVAKSLVAHFGIASPEQWFGLSAEGVRAGYYWQFVTYMFLHHDPLHLLANMLMLYFAGREVEAMIGPRHLLGIYFAGGVAGGIAQWLLPSFGSELVGASAGVCAVLIAFTTILPELKITALLFFVIPIRMKAKYLALLMVGLSALFFLTGAFTHIGHLAHLGGSVFGWIYVKQLGFGNPLRLQKCVFERRQRRERRERMSSEQFISEEIDPILDKISREGIHSLTRSERKLLEAGREKIAKKTSHRA